VTHVKWVQPGAGYLASEGGGVKKRSSTKLKVSNSVRKRSSLGPDTSRVGEGGEEVQH
jgi:hypothetical protein